MQVSGWVAADSELVCDGCVGRLGEPPLSAWCWIMTSARYDAVADFYEAGWSDSSQDPACGALLDVLGPVAGLRVLDIACGHGRVTRELGIRYIHADVTSRAWLDDSRFDSVVCSCALSDIDDLDTCVATVACRLRPGGPFVFSILHPCFPGGQNVSGSWPSAGRYYDEGRWSADGSLSTLRRQVGANHRMLSTYINTLRRHDLLIDKAIEPQPPLDWADQRHDAMRFPVFLVVRCVKGGAADSARGR
jgi:SAM-dependent methyltransferase